MPDYNEYLESIYSLLQPFLKEGVSLTEDTELVTELGLTSLQVMTMIEHIEDHFDISIPLNILPDVNTIGDLAQKVRELNL